tara:strand:+ start:509 stop:844 length:336 start_codon:yes stop_codon:yes gene_type:complete
MIWLIILCVLSIGANALLIWYIRKMLSKLLFVSDNIGNLLEEVDTFVFHLETIHEMETYYGDPTLGELIKHSKDLTEHIKNYREIYNLTNEGLDDELEEMEKFYESKEETE